MKKRSTILFALAVSAALSSLYLAGCTQSTSTATGVSTGVSVMQSGPTSAMVMWTRSSDDNGTDTVIAGIGSAMLAPVLAPSPAASAALTSLLMGSTYTISVHSSGGASNSVTFMLAGPPSGLKALSKSSSSISLKWTRDAQDMGADTVYQGNSVVGTSAGATYDATGLSEQNAYTFTVHTAGGNTNSITWMTAQRSATLKVYETSDPSGSDPSALVLGGTGGASVVSTSSGSLADFVLKSDGAVTSGITLEAGQQFDVTWPDTKVSDPANYIVGGLDNAWRSTSYQTEYNGAADNTYDIPADAGYDTKGSRVLIVHTGGVGHLALVEIVPDPSTHMLYSMNGSFKYVTVRVSYQSAAGQPYASRPHSSHSNGPEPRMSAK